VIYFHRLLIGTAIFFCSGFGGWLIVNRADRPGLMVLAGGFLLAAGGLVWYLKNLERFLGRR